MTSPIRHSRLADAEHASAGFPVRRRPDGSPDIPHYVSTAHAERRDAMDVAWRMCRTGVARLFRREREPRPAFRTTAE